MQTNNPDQNNLKDCNELYKSMIENSMDGICITQDGLFRFLNKAFGDLIGYQPDELLGKPATDVLAETDKERLIARHFQRMKGEHFNNIEHTSLQHKNGYLIDIEYTASAIIYEGEIASFISARDITERNRMQEKLEQSEQKYRNLVENAHDGIIITQFGKFKFVNKAFCNMVEYQEEELIENDFLIVVAEDEKQRLQEYHRLRMAGEKHQMIYEAKGISKSGKITYFELNTSYMEYEGHPATFVILRDHTEHRALEETLEKSEQKYRMLIEKAQDSILITQDGKFKFVNKAFCDITEYSKEELLELDFLQTIADEDHDRMRQIHSKRMEGDQQHLIYKATGISKSGKRVEFEINASYIEYEGRPATFVILRNLTERKLLEESLKRSERKYRELADLLPQTIFELDLNGHVTYLNKAGRIAFGLSDNDINFPAISCIVPEDHEKLLDNIKKAFVEKGREGGMEYTALRRDGTTFPIVIYSSPMTDNNEPFGIRGLVVDISERKAMEEALRKSEQHYRQVIQSLQEGLFVVQNDRFAFVNEAFAAILGYTINELANHYFVEILPTEYRQNAVKMTKCCEEDHSHSLSYEFLLLHKDGKTRIPVILSTNITEFDGIPSVVGTALNITDRIKAEEEIKLAHKRLEEINRDLEQTIRERTKDLTKANTQLLKLQKENLQSQFDVLKQQVNPHFLFNSLNVLTSLIRLEPELAEKFTEHLAKVYRYVLENKDNELVNLSTEISFLDAYIFLIKIRFMDKVVVNINIPDKKRNYRIIPLAMQLLIENAIKHNSMSKRSPLVIDISIDVDNQLNVVNNLQEREAHMTSTGVGLKNIQNRYRLLNNTVPVFEKTESHFIARIPLVAES